MLAVASLSFRLGKLNLLTLLLYLTLFTGCCKNDHEEPRPDVALPKLWEHQMPAEIYYCSPALSLDEKRVYFGTSGVGSVHPDVIHYFVALESATGKEVWRLPLGSADFRSTPAIAPDHSIYFAIEKYAPGHGIPTGDELWHVSSSGGFLWKFDINPSLLTMGIGLSTPAIGQDGTVFIGGDKLYAIKPDGSLRWTFTSDFPEAIRNSPAIGEDGTLYFVYHNVPLTALNPDDGSVIWSLPLGVNDHCFSSPAIGADGSVYVATQPGILYKVSPAGEPVWTFDITSAGFSGVFRSSPSVGLDGSVYIGLNNGNPSSALFCLNADGTLKWVFEPADLPADVPKDHFDIYSSPALGSDGNVYFGQEFGRVYVLNSSDGSLIAVTSTRSGITWSSPAIDKEGRLFISDLSGMVYALQTRSKGLDTLAPWPKYRHDNQNGGRKSS